MQFTCPICHYKGAFKTYRTRDSALCPNCLALERHRFQVAILRRFVRDKVLPVGRCLHFAPERSIASELSNWFSTYETADIQMKGVTHTIDIQSMPFEDESFDFIFASHVLEHVRDDFSAINELIRILSPGGIAVLPVPLMGLQTVEYEEPDPSQDYHVRAPGLDYFERYNQFSKVEIYTSAEVEEEYQPFVISDTAFNSPFHFTDNKINDYIPICYK